MEKRRPCCTEEETGREIEAGREASFLKRNYRGQQRQPERQRRAAEEATEK
jgi:hypothetical protein